MPSKNAVQKCMTSGALSRPGTKYGDTGVCHATSPEFFKTKKKQPYWRGRQEGLRRQLPTSTWTDVLSGLYISDEKRERGLKNILANYMRTGGVDERSTEWMKELPRKGSNWLWSQRGPTEDALTKLNEDLIWEAAAIRRRQQMDKEWEQRQLTDWSAANHWAAKIHREALETEAAKKAAMQTEGR